ncbi:MAG: hypothetical protein COB53_03235 [Elusimicrobia bacterium]|nr:MAG: hypothetical protein COB53_03235 [Elusimicrobiota bacterium]
MTIQGNEFSVGTSTLVAIDGKIGIGTSNPTSTITVNGTLEFMSGGGIKWADGSVSVSATSGNRYLLLSSGSVSGVSNVSFANLQSSASYHLDIYAIKTTNGIPYLRFNNNTGSVYGYGNVMTRYSSGSDILQSNSATSCRLISSNFFYDNTSAAWHLDFGSSPVDASYVMMSGTGYYVDAGAGEGGSVSCHYDPSSENALTSAKFEVDTGTFDAIYFFYETGK